MYVRIYVPMSNMHSQQAIFELLLFGRVFDASKNIYMTDYEDLTSLKKGAYTAVTVTKRSLNRVNEHRIIDQPLCNNNQNNKYEDCLR